MRATLMDFVFKNNRKFKSYAFMTEDIAELNTQADDATHRVAKLEMRVEKLMLISEGLWNLLKQEHGYTDEMLINKVHEIDSEDGILNNRVAVDPPDRCPKCGKVLQKNRVTCMYCETVAETDVFKR